MTRKEKFRNLITMFYNKICIDARFVMPVSTNEFHKMGEKVYASGNIREQKEYKVSTKNQIIKVSNVFLEEGLACKDRVSIQSCICMDFDGSLEVDFFINYNIMDLKGKGV